MTFRFPRPGLMPVLSLALMACATPALAGVAVIPLHEITPGMTGYGLTVFGGTAVDTFDVTVVGVQNNTRVAGSIIMVEVAGHGLERANIAQGMSGSPIFLDGRLAGALAFGWSGALRPLGGVTPAAEMLVIAADPPPPATGVSAPVQTDWSDLGTNFVGGLAADLGWTAPPQLELTDATTGEWPSPEELARRLVAATDNTTATPAGWICHPAAAGGSGRASVPAGPAALVPGSACAVPLVLGDAQLGAIGTVTWVDGNDVWAMGHPFLQRGPVRLPLATAEILTLFPSREMSFKIGTIGEVVGAVHQDRRPALVGRLGAVAPLLPVQVTVAGSDGPRVYEFRVADDPLLAGSLVFWTLYNALLAGGDDASLQTVQWHLDLDWRLGLDGPVQNLALDGTAAGPGGVAGLGAGIMGPLNLLRNNPFADVQFERVSIRLDTAPGLATAQILTANAPRRLPAGMATLPVAVSLSPRRGERRVETVQLPLPRGLEAGRYRLVVASAAEFFGLEVQRAAGRFLTSDLEAIVTLLGEARDPALLTVALLAPGRNVVVRGREMASMPASVRRTVRRGSGAANRTLADFVARQALPTSWLLQGHAVMDVEITAPVKPVEPERRP